MKFNRMLWALLALLPLSGALVSCSDDDPSWNDNGSKVELSNSRMFILNEGSFKMNNSNVSLYDFEKDEVTDDIYYLQNGMHLGDTGQDMITYGDNIYVSVYGSNYIAKLNTAGVEVARTSFVSDPELQGGVRYMAAKGNYIYASFHGGAVAKINATDLSVVSKITNLGANLEGVAIEGNNLYVCNSYSQTTNPTTGRNEYVYEDDLFVIDLGTFTKKDDITVGVNPNRLLEYGGKLYLISWGNYGAIGYSFQKIDPASKTVTALATATNMAAGNDKIYLVNSVTDWSTYTTTNTFFSYDVRAGQLKNTSFMQGAPTELGSASVYMMCSDPYTGDIYVGITNYKTSNGEMYRFRPDGSYLDSFDCGGQNPSKAVFFYK